MRNRIAVFATLLFVLANSSYAAFRTAVWIPPWNDAALPSIQKNAGAIQESNPVWYSWNADGSILKNWNAENATWRAAMTGSELIPTIQNIVNKSYDSTAVATMLGNATKRDAHVNAIASLVNTNAFDGIDIDYERVPTTSRADFTAFVNSLGAKLHAAGKKLSITVYAKVNDKATWSGPGAEDWSAIGAVADSVKIMAYDYHWDSSDAGAITPLTWLDQVATYAESVLPAKKIMMGLPWYGYDWPSSGTGATVNYSSATQRAQANNATISRDAVSGEATFTYNGRTVYFQDAAAYTAKLDMLKQKHGSIGGFAHWAAGDEDPAIWNVIKGTVTTTPTTPPPSGSNPATPAPTDFALTGASVLSVKQGTTASADYRVIAINGFNSTASVNASVLSPGFIGTVSATPSVSPSAPATLQVTPSRSTAPGVYQISVKATSGTMVREQLVNVTVTAATATKQRAAKH